MQPQAIRAELLQHGDSSPSAFPLSEFPKLLTGELKLTVPVYTVWGACEDVAILERIRGAPPGPISVSPSTQPAHTSGAPQPPSYSIPNLTVLSESTTRVLNIGGIRLRLFGLGGALVLHKLFDNGEGLATIAGGGGTMWTTILQIGELVHTAQQVHDPTETRLLVTHASPGREGLLAQLALVLKADLTLSAWPPLSLWRFLQRIFRPTRPRQLPQQAVGVKAQFQRDLGYGSPAGRIGHRVSFAIGLTAASF